MYKNNYWYFQSALTPEQCEKIITLGKERIEYLKSNNISTEATTHGNSHKQALKGAESVSDKTIEQISVEENIPVEEVIKKKYIRDSEICWLSDKWIYDLIWPKINFANDLAGWKFDLDWAEDFQFTVYNSPGGFYGWHYDGMGDWNSVYQRYIDGVSPTDEKGNKLSGYTTYENFVGKVRKLSVTINLNKPGEYEGGNLKFDYGPHSHVNRFHECEEIRPQGSIIVFPSSLYHQVTPVTKGTRYSLVLWTLGKPFR
jgi:PKHD-type hydroxylase